MIVMMWPALTKVQYEKLPTMFTTRALWEQLLVSLVINWVIGPFVSAPVSSGHPADMSDNVWMCMGCSTRLADISHRCHHGRIGKVGLLFQLLGKLPADLLLDVSLW
jgi:hypothetical protein